jgi:hypothetical protein
MASAQAIWPALSIAFDTLVAKTKTQSFYSVQHWHHGNPVRALEDSDEFQLDCARQVVRVLFDETKLSTICSAEPAVIVGMGNWISFTADQPVSIEMVLSLCAPSGKVSFVADMLNRERARSRTSPSLHLTNLGSAENLIGHVDAHYWASNPLGHADEFLKKRTTPPSELLKRLLQRD